MKSRAPLAMMEQMVMILVFALAAALCLQAFVKSDQMSRRSGARDRAAAAAQSAAEAIRHAGGIEAGLELACGAVPLQRDGFGAFIPYDEDWNVIGGDGRPQSSSYTLRAVELDSGVDGLGKASIEVFAWSAGAMESIFSIEVAWQEVNPHG